MRESSDFRRDTMSFSRSSSASLVDFPVDDVVGDVSTVEEVSTVPLSRPVSVNMDL